MFLKSDIIPSARGFVKVKQDDNENYDIRLSIDHLAESTRLNPPKEVYVIWMESDHNTIRNIGQINRGSHANNLKASLETTSPYPPTRIFITAEDDAMVQYPGDQRVLTTGLLKN